MASAQFIGGGGGSGGGSGGGGGGGAGGGIFGQESGGTDLGVLNFLFSGAKTGGPWDHLGSATRILRSVACDQPELATLWRRGGDSRRAVVELARDAYWLARPDSPKARNHFGLFPERRTLIQQVASGALSCAAALAMGAPERGRVRAKRVHAAQREAQRITAGNVATAAAAAALPGIPQPGVPQLPPGQREPSWVTLVRILSDQYRLYQEQQLQRARERAQRRALRMSLSDTVGDILGSVAQAVPSILPAVIGAQQASAQRAQQNRLARLQLSALGLPGGVSAGVGSTAAVLASLLGEEPGALESGGMLENLGLEGDLERTVTLWKRTAGGFRAVPQFYGVHPTSGRLSVWKNMGPCILFRGDLAAKRRVEDVARLAARGGHRRRARSPFRRRRRA